jgi:hypothetical protein
VGAKSKFSEIFNVNLKYLVLSLETGFFILILIRPIHNLKQKKSIFYIFFSVLKLHLKIFHCFSGAFWGMSITAATDNFWQTVLIF